MNTSPSSGPVCVLDTAMQLQREAAGIGFDWTDAQGVIEKIHEELAEVSAHLPMTELSPSLAMELGDVLFSCINLVRFLNADPGRVLQLANQKFAQRYQKMLELLQAQGIHKNTTLVQFDKAWCEVKQQEK